MAINDILVNMVENGTESLSIEFKTWLDLNQSHGKAKLIKGLIALYNNNGGYFVIGINDKTGSVDETSAPEDIYSSYHPDLIQGLVGKYSSLSFEIKVEFVKTNEAQVPIICVPDGV